MFKLSMKSSSIYTRFILSFSAMITIFILILSFILFKNYSSNTINSIREYNLKILSQISYSANYMDEISKNLCVSYFSNNDIIPMMFAKEENIWHMGNTIKKLSESIDATKYIQSVYIYNKNLDIIYSTELNSFKKSAEFYDFDIVSILKENKNNEVFLKPIPRIINIKDTGNDSTAIVQRKENRLNVFSYIICEKGKLPGSIDGALVLNINESWLRNIINSMNTLRSKDLGEVFIVNDKGVIVSHPNNKKFLEKIESGYINEILKSQDKEGFFIYDNNGIKYSVSYVSLDNLNWKFVSLTPYQETFQSLTRIKIITSVICFVVLGIGVVTSLFFSRRLYKPIGVLTDKVKEEFQFEKPTDEISLISNAFNNIVKRLKTSEYISGNSIYQKRSEFLKKVVIGTERLNKSEEIRKKLEYLGVQITDAESFFIIILKIDNFDNFLQCTNDRDRALIRFAICNIASEVLGEYFKNEAIDMGKDHICILANINSEIDGGQEEIKKILEEKIKSTQFYIKEHYNVSITGIVEYMANDWNQVAGIYEQLLDVSKYRLIFGHSSVIFSEDAEVIKRNEKKFTAWEDNALYEAIKQRDTEKAIKTYDYLIESLALYSYDIIRAEIIHLSYKMFEIVNEIDKKLRIGINADINMFTNKVSSLETIQEINQLFYTLIKDIINSINNNKEKVSDAAISKVILIINQNYYDKNLCLNNIANMVHMSPVYLGKVFKDATGKSISEYINTVRLDKVRNYLETTNFSINEIIEKVGIEKSSYFYTQFKKYYGVSISEYKAKIIRDIE